MKDQNPYLAICTNRSSESVPLYNQAFLDYQGVVCSSVINEKPNKYIMNLHNEFIDTAAIVLNISENVFVFDMEALLSFATRQVIERIEVCGVTAAQGHVQMSDAFNIIIPKTTISGKNYFAQMHQLEKDLFITYDFAKDAPGILLLNQAGLPFAIWAGQIKYAKCPPIDFDACYQYALEKKNQYITAEQTA